LQTLNELLFCIIAYKLLARLTVLKLIEITGSKILITPNDDDYGDYDDDGDDDDDDIFN
jgi:hypothetical protein